jgi:hypothetical protein
MAHPLASALAKIIDRDVEQLHEVVARWVVVESDPEERARYRAFGSELSAVKRRIKARETPPTQEEIEIALAALLVLAGRRAGVGPKAPRATQP